MTEQRKRLTYDSKRANARLARFGFNHWWDVPLGLNDSWDTMVYIATRPGGKFNYHTILEKVIRPDIKKAGSRR
ncbi:MAG: hypothetical protein UT63_C0019G0012 [Candidatus Gottesmanbacteria bacterium GW2011_GWC2_39_8]|uniref:Uncharacterized protein n=1 Tax=Candidatus Gottesmanbacteria bacterium GW2011_GWC2_39_8 TaxID=1618450 RepID=A0A0G0SEZ5_9BACT|nr:MAG: hypothetical protein UT63_C0019G0012 [Candidatus Gottesmanbacteria bacterium GW2011_GWC2_39_8]